MSALPLPVHKNSKVPQLPLLCTGGICRRATHAVRNNLRSSFFVDPAPQRTARGSMRSISRKANSRALPSTVGNRIGSGPISATERLTLTTAQYDLTPHLDTSQAPGIFLRAWQ